MISYLHQFLPDLPREDPRIVPLHFFDLRLDLRGGYPRLAAADHARPDGTGFLVAVQNFRNAAVRNAELPRYHARTHPSRCHFDDFQANVIRERPAVDEDATQLIHASLSCREHFVSIEAFDLTNTDTIHFYSKEFYSTFSNYVEPPLTWLRCICI